MLEKKSMLKNVKILVAKKSNLLQSAVSILEEDGVVIIRDLFKKKIISDLDEKWKLYFRKPTVSGTIGYHRTSHPKADIPAFLLGRPSLEVALEKKVINIIEKIMKSECTLSEANAIWHRPTKYTYFPIHTDFKIGWKKSSNSKVSVSEKDLKKPLGIGTMLYMHDTSSGAFSYSLGSHKLKCKNGQHLENYPPEVRQEIKKNIRICKGKKGDLVIFDDRGFHGPDQPSNAHRSVLLFDYYRNDTFGSVVVVSHLVRITDLAHLNNKQLKVLGLKSKELVESDKYVGTRFKNNFFFSKITWFIDKAYFFTHLKSIFKSIILKKIVK